MNPMDYLPTTIRGHHLQHLVKNKSLEEWEKMLIQGRYIIDSSSPFLHLVYNAFKNLKDNPTHHLTVVSGECDSICNECPRKKECMGSPNIQQLLENIDDAYITKAKLVSGNEYRVSDIILSFEYPICRPFK